MDYPFVSQSVRRLTAISIWATATAIFSACAETSGPFETPQVAILSPVSSMLPAGVVDTDLATLPTVFAHDTKGKPLAGITVVFRLTGPGGSLYTPIAETSASGLASPSGWRLGTQAGEQVVVAVAGSQTVVFRVTALAGPAATFGKLSGDNQQAPGGTEVTIPPKVQLMDAYSNPVVGMPVHFAVEAGGGSLTGDNVTTNSEGVATLGSWTLGLTADQRVVANAGTLAPVTFRATAVEPMGQCASAPRLNTATVKQSTLTDGACHAEDGRFMDTYSVTLPEEGIWLFTLVSNAFDTRIELRDENGIPIASNRTDNSTTNSAIKAILPAGRITVVITSVVAGATGAYEVYFAKALIGVDGCEVSITRGVSTDTRVGTGGSCTPNNAAQVDRYRIYLTAGSYLSLLLEDYSLSDNRFELDDDTGTTQAVAVVKNYVESTLNFKAAIAGYYVILVQVAERYSLTVK